MRKLSLFLLFMNALALVADLAAFAAGKPTDTRVWVADVNGLCLSILFFMGVRRAAQ